MAAVTTVEEATPEDWKSPAEYLGETAPVVSTQEQEKLDREEQRIKERDRRLTKKLEENQQVLILGSFSHIASHILLKFLEAVPNSHITIADTRDPTWAFQNPALRDYRDTTRVTAIHHSPHDWSWLEERRDDYNIIIAAESVHDAKYCYNNPIDAGHRNAMQAINFMHALTKGSGWSSEGKLIYLSTDKVYGPQPISPTPENVPINPVGVRASTRAAQELLMTGLAKNVGIHYIVLRLGTSYGEYTPREKAIYSWCRNLLMGEPVYMHGSFAKNDSPARDWIHVDDIAAITAYTSLTDWPTNTRDEVYNIGGCENQPHYLWNVCEAMKTVLKRGTMTIKKDWRDPGERSLRIWLDCKKAQEKLLLQPSVEFLLGIARRLPVWIAFHDLMWTESQIIELKKGLGMRDVEKGTGAMPVGQLATK